MKPHRYTAQAQRDMQAIVDQIAADRPMEAGRLTDRLSMLLNRICSYPEAGRDRNDLQRNLRSASISPYLLFDIDHAEEVRIVRILDGRRDLNAVFLEEPIEDYE